MILFCKVNNVDLKIMIRKASLDLQKTLYNIYLNTSQYFHCSHSSFFCIFLLVVLSACMCNVLLEVNVAEETGLLYLALLSAGWRSLPVSPSMQIVFLLSFLLQSHFHGLSFLHDCRDSDSNTLKRRTTGKEGYQDTNHTRSNVNFALMS